MVEYFLNTPISEAEVRKLKIGDTIYVSGLMFTARDEAHRRALEYYEEEKKLPINLEGLVLFHCGPIVKKVHNEWKIIAAGPTTSARMELFEDEFIKDFGVRVVIGKGGMGPRTTKAMKEFGAVYGAFTGGAAVLAAKTIQKVKGVEWLDLGVPEALWLLVVKDFGPLTVAIDTHGNNLFSEVMKKVEEKKKRIYQRIGLTTH